MSLKASQENYIPIKIIKEDADSPVLYTRASIT